MISWQFVDKSDKVATVFSASSAKQTEASCQTGLFIHKTSSTPENAPVFITYESKKVAPGIPEPLVIFLSRTFVR